jgi:hypothetical protein
MKRVCVLILLLFSIGFVSAMSYNVVDWKIMKTGDTWANIPGGGNITLNSLIDSNHAATTLSKYGSMSLNLTKGVIFQYNVAGYVFNVTSISISSGHSGMATLYILQKVCTPDWQCSSWGQCTDGVQWRTCKDINECGISTGLPNENQLCCNPSWACSIWSVCINNQQTRTCKDGNKCGTLDGEPALTQSCVSPNVPAQECVEDWACSQWSDCINNLFTRTCTDLNNCGTEKDEPYTSLACTTECLENWQCSSWSACINNQKIRTCNDLNDCGTFSEMPALISSCNLGNAPNQNPAPQNPSNQDVPIEYPVYYSSGWSYLPANFTINSILPDPININLSDIPIFKPGFFIWWILLLLLYIYISLTYTFIGRRAKAYHYGIAWVPLIGPMLVSSRSAQMGSWPILLFVALFLSLVAETILMFTPLILFSFILNYLDYVLIIIFLVYWFIWSWKMFRAVNRPGWWSLVNIVPVLGWIAFLIFLGVAAWGKFDNLPLKAAAKIAKTVKSKKKK